MGRGTILHVLVSDIRRVNYDVLESFQSCITETYSEATTLKAAGQR